MSRVTMTRDESQDTGDHAPDAPELDDLEVTHDHLETLYLEGLISRRDYDQGRTWLWPLAIAWEWLDRGLLWMGLGLVLAGVVFLFAYNWHAIPNLGKLAFIEAAIGASIVGAGWRGWETRAGRAGLIAACTLVGVFLAVFGQIYQTGADSWELFAGWAGLIAGYVVLSRSPFLWLFWLALLHVGACLYVEQTYLEPSPLETLILFLGLGMLDAVALGLREWGHTRFEWLHPRWPRWCLVAATLTMISLPAWWYLALSLFKEFQVGAALISGGAWGLTMVGHHLYFRHIEVDLPALALTGLAAAALPVLMVFRWTTEWFEELISPVGLLAAGVVIFALTGMLIGWLRSIPTPDRTSTSDVDRSKGASDA